MLQAWSVCLLHHLTFFLPVMMYFHVSELLVYAESFSRNLCWKLKRLLKGIVNHLRNDSLVTLFSFLLDSFWLYCLILAWILHKFRTGLSCICFTVARNANACLIVNIVLWSYWNEIIVNVYLFFSFKNQRNPRSLTFQYILCVQRKSSSVTTSKIKN
jgi:hypothetical protein